MDNSITELFKKFEEVTRPTTAFITFNNDESAFAALQMNKQDKYHVPKMLMAQEMKFSAASEPTDIIWENRRFGPRQYLKRELIAYVILSIVLAGSIAVVYQISAISKGIADVYPTTDCDNLKESYGTDLQSFAVADFDYITANPGEQSSGCLQCFCTDQYADASADWQEDSYGQADGIPICKQLSADLISVLFWTNALSYILIGFNYVLTMVCIMAVDWIGYATETKRLTQSTTFTWLVSHFNTGWILLMVNANMTEQPLTFGLTGGQYSDFNSGWFRQVGNIIVGSMAFNVYYPIIEAVGYYLMRLGFRILDRKGFSCDDRKTKSSSVQSYMDVVDGPIYYIHYKYSSILNITFVTFMYGFGMPILFPIAAISLLVLYLVEKILLFYAYRLPPMYDEHLSQNVLNKLQFAPILFCLFGYWMVSNLQLMSNEHLNNKAQSSSSNITDHTMGTVFSGLGWEGLNWPFLALFVFLSLYWYVGDGVLFLLYKCFPWLEIGDVDLDEEIGEYWESLDAEDRQWSLKEEENNRDALNMKLLTDEQHLGLINSAMTKDGKTLMGTHSYDILANPLYLDDFQYVSAAQENRAECIIDDDDEEGNDAAQSDMVRVALNLAYYT